MDRIKQLYRKYPLKTMMLLSFVVPILIIGGFYISRSVFPFGGESMFTYDLGQQYVDFYEYYRDTILNGEWDAITYSFEKGVGGNMMGTWTYYLMSPTLLITLLLPQTWMSMSVAIMTLFKIGIAGLSFQYLLGRKFGKADWKTFIISFSYSMMSYLAFNHMNIMWLDTVVVLPFVVWGIEKISKGESWHFYTFWLTFSIVTNYYIGYMVAIFSVLYFAYSLFINASKEEYLVRIGRFALGSIVSGAISSFVLLPTIYNLQTSKATNNVPEYTWSLLHPIRDIFSKGFNTAFVEKSLISGPMNLYVGILGLIATVLYFIQSKIPRKERITSFAMLAFLFLSANIEMLNVFWHGMQAPMGYPFRFSFVITLFILLLAYQGFQSIDHLKLSHASIGVALAGAYTLFYLLVVDEYDYLHEVTMWAWFLFIIIFLLLLLIKDHFPKVAVAGMILISIADMSINNLFMLSLTPYDSHDDYVEFIDLHTDMIDELTPGEKEFHRLEKTYARSRNDGMQLDYYGVAHFNSVLEGSTTKSLGKLGVPNHGHTITYASGNPLADALLGVKYIIDSADKWHLTQEIIEAEREPEEYVNSDLTPDAPKSVLENYPIISTTPHFQIHENPDALPLGYGVPSTLNKIDIEELHGGNDVHDAVYKSLSRSEDSLYALSEETLVDIHVENLTITEKNNTPVYSRIDMDKDTSIEYTFHFETDDGYLMEWDYWDNRENMVYYDDVFVKNISGSINPWFVDMALNDAGKTKRLKIQFDDTTDDLYVNTPTVYQLNHEKITNLSNRLRSQSFEIETFKQNHITGSIFMTQPEQYIMFSIPYDKGWTATANGEEVELEPLIGGLFSGIPVDAAGRYNVELSYKAPGLHLGVTISLFGLGFYIATVVRKRKNK